MDKNGLLNELFLSLSNEIEAYQLREESNVNKAYQKAVLDTTQALKKAYKEKDLPLLMETELILLATEYNETTNSNELDSSILQAFEQFSYGSKNLPHVFDSGKYSTLADGFNKSMRDKSGLPEDSFRKLLNSHITRLRNRKVSRTLSQNEKEQLEQRKENMILARELYKDLQRKALGIEIGRGI